MSVFRNSRGQFFQSGRGGTYPINDGNPENDVDDFYEERAQRIIDDAEERAHDGE